jgi:GNAT superfamily N-acetyltransferase
MTWSFRPATADDLEPLADLRAAVMRPDLERLGRYDEHRVRQRLRDGFSAAHTRIIEVDGEFAGSIALRPAADRSWLEHFYLAARHQGRGVGSAVLRSVLEQADADGTTLSLNVLQGSPAEKLYARHGFVVESEDPVDVFMVRKFL